jgi:CMP-N,N'-diacetyllegionaminic acid synthase
MQVKNKSLGIITARGGSKGIPRKNVKLFDGLPLIYYTINAALESNLNEVIVSTDCEEIAEISNKYNAKVSLRPASLSKDDTPTLDVLKYISRNIDKEYEIFVTLQPTSPFRTSTHINEALSYFYKNSYADSLVSVQIVPHSFDSTKLMKLEGVFLHGNNEIIRRQNIHKFYARNGAIYITKKCNLDLGIFSGNILPYPMDKISSIDIDDEEDWLIGESVKSNLLKI